MQPADWLALHPHVASAIMWEDQGGGLSNYTHWHSDRRNALNAEYAAFAAGKPTQLKHPPANLLTMKDDQFASTRISADDAWRLWLAHVACGLWCEIGRQVPWSIADYPQSALRILFDSREMFRWRNTPAPGEEAYGGAALSGYEFEDRVGGWIVPGPPAQMLRWLRDTGIVKPVQPERSSPFNLPQKFEIAPAAKRKQTVYAMIDWCRRLAHFANNLTGLNVQQYWQYRGFPPVMRVLGGTVNPQMPGAATSSEHYTAGCWGTAGLLRAVLRAVNIPVEVRVPTVHAQAWFPLENEGLCHGDDPYIRRARFFPEQVNQGTIAKHFWSAPFGVKEIMIGPAEWLAWFGQGVPAEAKTANIEHRAQDLELKYISYNLLSLHCGDLSGGTTKVADYFKPTYTVADLKAAKLWERIAEKLAAAGGCPVVT
jgi:hypothetical protein